MKRHYFTFASNLFLTLLTLFNFSFSQTTVQPTESFVRNSIEQSLASIGSVSFDSTNHENFSELRVSHLRAPNSYIYDIDLAKENQHSGIKIPITKAFQMWDSPDWYLNQNLSPNDLLSAFIYWEDVHGLIENVSIENTHPVDQSKIAVMVNPTKGKGNALISLHYGKDGNSNDPIIWSWHIWVTDDPTNGVVYDQDIETDIDDNPISIKYMDRNLGSLYNHILGYDWHRTVGLLYQWGRKDPIPTFVNRDYSFYELNGLVGNMRNREGIHHGNILPEVPRPFTDIHSNLKFSIQNPIAYLIAHDNGTWFSQQQYKAKSSNADEVITWDLWGDNREGMQSNASSSNSKLKQGSRSYELKSPYDPCPNGWRVPSHLGRVTLNNNHSPWGRNNSGGNDDLDPQRSEFFPDKINEAMSKAKVYMGLGIDFSEAENRNIGIFPNTGVYVINPDKSVVYQDQNALTTLWTATYSLGGARQFKLISDPLRYDISEYGVNLIKVNTTGNSTEALSVRCIQDPNLHKIGNFETEFIYSKKAHFTTGLNHPNSYLILDETEVEIPVSKAFAVHQHLFPNEDFLPSEKLIANVFWTDNKDLIKTVNVVKTNADPKLDKISVQLNPEQKGNAIVSLHNGSISNPVYWTWHIWVVADEVKEITYVNQTTLPETSGHFIHPTASSHPPLTTTFMDRNLGAVHDLPFEILENPELPLLQNEVKLSGGFHYQWGRKDPIPSFQHVGSLNSYEIYKGINVDNQGRITYQIIDANSYQNHFTQAYDQYKNFAQVNKADLKHQAANKIIAYSIQNPLTYLHHNTTKKSDWISDEMAVQADRWGHGTKKSIYDPCPKGWRVPDVFTVFQNTRGSSPWFNGKKLSSLQGNPQYIGSHYGGKFVSYNNQSFGWIFSDENYFIGQFPATGIIGKNHPTQLSGNKPSQAIAGVWTAALTEYMRGDALAMKMGILADQDHRLISGGNHSPVQGLNVRCSKDEVVYAGDLGENQFILDLREFDSLQTTTMSEKDFYPNPVKDYLYALSQSNYEAEVYNLQGQLVYKGKFEQGKLNLNSIQKGVYLGVFSNPQNNQKVKMKLIKSL